MPTNRETTSSETESDVSIEEWAAQLGLAQTAVLTTPEAAELLRVSERMVRDLIKDGTVPSVRLGRRVLIPVPALLRTLVAPSAA